jgi:hypothetical protein
MKNEARTTAVVVIDLKPRREEKVRGGMTVSKSVDQSSTN